MPAPIMSFVVFAVNFEQIWKIDLMPLLTLALCLHGWYKPELLVFPVTSETFQILSDAIC